jgi:hypothetical protein
MSVHGHHRPYPQGAPSMVRAMRIANEASVLADLGRLESKADDQMVLLSCSRLVVFCGGLRRKPWVLCSLFQREMRKF